MYMIYISVTAASSWGHGPVGRIFDRKAGPPTEIDFWLDGTAASSLPP